MNYERMEHFLGLHYTENTIENGSHEGLDGFYCVPECFAK